MNTKFKSQPHLRLFAEEWTDKINERWLKGDCNIACVPRFGYVMQDTHMVFEKDPESDFALYAPNPFVLMPETNGHQPRPFDSPQQEGLAIHSANYHIEKGFRSFEELQDSCKGQTLIMCGSAPGLKNIVSKLENLDKRISKVMAINGSLPIVKDYADYFFIVDTYADWNWYHNSYRDNIKLICCPHANCGTRAFWTKESTYLFSTQWSLVHQDIAEKTRHLPFIWGILLGTYAAFNIAVKMGFEKIILIGQEFSFPNQEQRYCLDTMREWVQDRNILIVDDCYGGEIQTYDYLIREKNAIKAISIMCEDNGIEVYNCSEAGILDIDRICTMEEIKHLWKLE